MGNQLSISEIRAITNVREMMGREELPIAPSKRYRMAMRPTKRPYDPKHAKMRRKMAKASRKRNRH